MPGRRASLTPASLPSSIPCWALRDNFQLLTPSSSLQQNAAQRCQQILVHHRVEEPFPSTGLVFDGSSLGLAPPSRAEVGGSRFQQNGNRSKMSGDSDSGGSRCSGLLWL